jgi:hypothetical protein
MTTETSYSLAQLAQILSALENERRNPNTKRNAIKAIERNAARLGLSCDDILASTGGLLDGRMSAAEFRAEVESTSDGCGLNQQQHKQDDEVHAAPSEVDHAGTEAPPPMARREWIDGKWRWRTTGGDAADAAPASTQPKARRQREGTKTARFIEMLRRPEGATVDQLAEAMGWARHTVRGAMAGALKKKLGLTITSEKVDGGNRTYRIA